MSVDAAAIKVRLARDEVSRASLLSSMPGAPDVNHAATFFERLQKPELLARIEAELDLGGREVGYLESDGTIAKIALARILAGIQDLKRRKGLALATPGAPAPLD